MRQRRCSWRPRRDPERQDGGRRAECREGDCDDDVPANRIDLLDQIPLDVLDFVVDRAVA
jgi:hypothetical protein